jgi:hypothetical protein
MLYPTELRARAFILSAQQKYRSKLCNSVEGREAEAYTSCSVRYLDANPSSDNTLPCLNARQSKTFYDIVLVIDAYRLYQVMTPEMLCIHAGRFSSRERLISEPYISR